MVLSGVCLLAGMVLFQSCQEANAPATGVKTEAKEVKPEVKPATPAVKTAEPNAVVKETKPEVKVEAKEAKPEVKAEVQEAKPAAPEVKAAEPNAVAENTGVAVTVNGKDITEADVDAKMNAYMIEPYKRPQVVESMVVEQLLDEQIKKANINITDSDVNNKLNELIAEKGMTMESLKTAIAAQGGTLDQIKEQIKRTLSYEKLMGPVEINDAEAKAFYEENKDKDFLNRPEQVKASHIFLKVDASATPEQKAAVKAKIDGLLKQAKAGGDFAALAKENSDDAGSKIRGGDLGFFDRNTIPVKEFTDAAFATKVGEVSGVVETQYGYHIIKVTDRKEGGLTPFDKAKTDIVKSLQDKKKSEIFKQLREKIKAEAKIVYPPGKEPKPRMPMMPRGPRPNGQAPQPESEPAPK